MKVTAQTVFDLIKYCLFDGGAAFSSLSELSEDNLTALYKFSKAHDVAHIVGAALKKAGIASDSEAYAKLLSEIDIATYRYVKQKNAFCEIKSVLDREKIDYIPLKGSVLRDFYPEQYLRTSSDIDIFVRKEDVERAKKAFIDTCGYKTVIIGDEHDVSFISPSGVHLELHFRFVENLPKAEKILNNVWQFAVKNDKNG